MADKKVFVSFEFDRDRTLKESFVSQANDFGLQLRVEDSSLREQYPAEEWRKIASQAIHDSDWVIIVIGQDTHTANGVRDELNMANQHGRRILQIRPRRTNWGLVDPNIDFHSWKWKTIRNHLDGKHNGCRAS